MKTRLLLIITLFFSAVNGFAGGRVIESLEFKGKILNYPEKYSVYLPEDYDTSQRTYPVIYLLHGATDDETSWIQFGEANRILDESIKNGIFPPAIVLMPDAKLTWYSNDAEKKNAWRDMFINEFIPSMEKNYRIKAKKEFRAIVGLSMGGFGALSIALNYPDMFSICVPMSAAFYSNEEVANMNEEGYSSRFEHICGVGLKGKDRINSHWNEVNPFDLLEKLPFEKANSIKYYFDCGDDDRLLKGNMFMHLKMNELNIQHEFRVRNGKHEWSYWRSGLFDALKFIGEGFRR